MGKDQRPKRHGLDVRRNQQQRAWVESASRFIRTDEECECDCWLCQQQPPRHHEGCFTADVVQEVAP